MYIIIMYVKYIKCLIHVSVIMFKKSAISTISQRFQNIKEQKWHLKMSCFLYLHVLLTYFIETMQLEIYYCINYRNKLIKSLPLRRTQVSSADSK